MQHEPIYEALAAQMVFIAEGGDAPTSGPASGRLVMASPEPCRWPFEITVRGRAGYEFD